MSSLSISPIDEKFPVTMRSITLFVFLCVLQGCGQKGALFIPASQPQATVVEKSELSNSAVQPLPEGQ